MVEQRNHKKNVRRKEVSRFQDLTTFSSAEADLLCSASSSCYAVKEVEKATDSTHQEPNPKYGGKKSAHNTKSTEESSKEPNKTSKSQPQCSFRKKTDHLLNAS